jgi:hypothetical protein
MATATVNPNFEARRAMRGNDAGFYLVLTLPAGALPTGVTERDVMRFQLTILVQIYKRSFHGVLTRRPVAHKPF